MAEGIAGWCLKTIVRHSDLMTARAHIKEDRDRGKTFEEQLREMKCFTGGKLLKLQQVRIAKPLLTIFRENIAEQTRKAKEKSDKELQDYIKCVQAASDLLESGINPDQKINIKQLKILIAPYRLKEDPQLP